MLSMTPTEAAPRKVKAVLEGGFNTGFIGTKDATSGPHAFLVEGLPGYTIKPHFHGVNQYQVCVAGGGVLGKNALSRGAFHYADKFTPYGPIVAGENGLAFFTLRQHAYALGAHYVPGSKEAKKGPTGRNIVTRADVDTRTAGIRVLIDEADGVRAYELSADAGAGLPDADGRAPHGSAYVVVLRGEVIAGGRSYPERSLMFIPEDEALPSLSAGPAGALALFLAFARGS
jgi:hypothetical protein